MDEGPLQPPRCGPDTFRTNWTVVMAGMIFLIFNVSGSAQPCSRFLTLPIFYQWLLEPTIIPAIGISINFVAQTRHGIWLGRLAKKSKTRNELRRKFEEIIRWSETKYRVVMRVESILAYARLTQIFLALLGISEAALDHTGPGADLKTAWNSLLIFCRSGAIVWFWFARALLWLVVLLPYYTFDLVVKCQLEVHQRMQYRIRKYRAMEQSCSETLQFYQRLKQRPMAEVKKFMMSKAYDKIRGEHTDPDVAADIAERQGHEHALQYLIDTARQDLGMLSTELQAATAEYNEWIRE